MMVSYSGNREDVLLDRVFGGKRDGFFIDIGANDPVGSSITWHFYEQLGWHGINIEPIARFHSRLQARRPRDINLQVAASDRVGEMTIYEHDDEWGCLSTMSAKIAETHRKAGYNIAKTKVPLRRLADICEEYVQGDIDLLCIDVEGHERQVLAGADFKRYRPRVIVIEATVPMSRQPSHAGWEPLVIEAGYKFAFFDGANRYYVRKDEKALLAQFHSPVCGFDKYVPAEQVDLERRLAEAEADKQKLRSEIAALHAQLEAVQQRFRSIGPTTVAMANRYSSIRQAVGKTGSKLDLVRRFLSGAPAT